MRSVTSSSQPSMTAQEGGLQHYRIREGNISVAPLAKTYTNEFTLSVPDIKAVFPAAPLIVAAIFPAGSKIGKGKTRIIFHPAGLANKDQVSPVCLCLPVKFCAHCGAIRSCRHTDQ